jgi:SAM-dependent methyltransferase
MDVPEGSNFFDRYGPFGSPDDIIRLRHRYEAIVTSNYELFRDARVLNFHCGDGRWCLAALDAGAAHVIGLDSSRRIETARSAFIQYGIASEVHQFISSDTASALKTMDPGAFDLIVCQQPFEQLDPRIIFSHLYRLAPKHVILDSTISRGNGPIMRFEFKSRDATAPKGTRRHGLIVAAPNHDLIAFLCEYFRFAWREIDWHTMGIEDWRGIHDYERGRRRTYVLQLL